MLTEDQNQSASGERTILEVRIHGVLNSPPRDMLLLEDDGIRRVNGDALGAFYTTAPEKAPGPVDGRPETDDLARVRREAYSWGAMPRSAGGGFSVIGTFFVQLGWLLVAPYGLVNMAYWMRDVPVVPPIPQAGAAAESELAAESVQSESPAQSEETTESARPAESASSAESASPAGSARPAESASPGGSSESRRRDPPGKLATTTWRGGRGSGSIRLFALALTLLLVVTVSVIALDVVGVQCYQPEQRVCSQLPAVFDVIAPLVRPARLAVLGLLPILAVLLVYLISRRGRVRYEANVRGWIDKLGGGSRSASASAPASALTSARRGKTDVQSVPTTLPHLATENFWSSARIGQTTEYLHFAASVAFVLLLLGVDLVWSRSGVCSVLDNPEEDCVGTALRDKWGWLGVAAGLAAAAILVVSAVIVWTASTTKTTKLRSRRALALGLLVAAGTTYAAYAVVAIWWSTVDAAACAAGDDPSACFAGDDAVGVAFIGLRVSPAVLIIVAAAVCVSATGWMRGVPLWLSLPLGVTWVGLVIASIATWTSNTVLSKALLAGGVAALLLIALAGWLWPHRFWAHRNRPSTERRLLIDAERRRLAGIGWHGCGAAVTLSLALFAAMTLSTMFVMGVTAYLTIPEWTVSTTEMLRGRPQAAFGSPESQIVLPPAYTRFSVVVAVVLAVIAIVGGVAAVVGITRYFEYSTPSLVTDDRGDEVLIAHVADYRPGGRARRLHVTPDRPTNLQTGEVHDTPHVKRVLATRRRTQFAHRGEPLLGLIAIVSLAAAITIMVTPLRRAIMEFAQSDGRILPAITAPMLAVVALALLGFVFQNSRNSKERPLGLLWDIMGLLPRAGHPFGPPCYTERVVPELSARIDEWLGIDAGGEGDRNAAQPATKPGNRVVLSAHSLGLPLAVAVILGNSGRDGWRGRIGLMSFGVQIRSYFGRFFPSVYGPEVLGVHPVVGPSLFRADPWTKAVQADWERARDGRPDVDGGRFKPTLREVLTWRAAGDDRPRKTAWLNLWRRTDYLGMPAYSYADWSTRKAREDSVDLSPPPTNPIDSGATERLAEAYIWGVATHSNYLETRQFETGFLEVVRRLEPSPATTVTPTGPDPHAAVLRVTVTAGEGGSSPAADTDGVPDASP